jgi:hypothetical protein
MSVASVFSYTAPFSVISVVNHHENTRFIQGGIAHVCQQETERFNVQICPFD